jgi:membrane protein
VRKGLPRPARALADRLLGHDILLLSAGVAFYGVVSVAPLMILSLWAIGLIVGESGVERFADQLERLAPRGIGVSNLFDQVARTGSSAGVIALLAALWPASAYGSGLARAFERLSAGETRFEGARGRGLALALLLPLFVLGGLVGSYAGTAILGDGTVSRVAGLAMALGTGFVGIIVVTLLIYRLFPPDPLHWRVTVRVAALVSAAISFASLLFTLYVSFGADFEKRYASSGVALVVLLGLWLFVANAVLLAGYRATQHH